MTIENAIYCVGHTFKEHIKDAKIKNLRNMGVKAI